MGTEPTRAEGRIVLLAGPGDATAIVYHFLERRFGDVTAIVEDPVPRVELARRRARRLGWPAVAGQVAFVTVAMPLLGRAGRRRVSEIVGSEGLDVAPMHGALRVGSVNDPTTAARLRELDPAVVVVSGTRIISARTLDLLSCPVINVHAGLTPRYRGVHGGYWALAEGRPDLVGTTVHLVDRGIDTGAVLAQVTFEVTPRDSITTYPYLHLARGLPLLAEHVAGVLAQVGVGATSRATAEETSAQAAPRRATDVVPGALEESRLRWHPTLWGYLWRRVTRGVR